MSVITLKIDVSKIDKNRLFRGEKGTYLDAVVLLRDQPDQYGNNGMIVQSVTPKERAAGVRGPILGNCKVLGNQQTPPQQYTDNAPDLGAPDFDDDIPF